MTKREWTIIGVLGTGVAVIFACLGCLGLNLLSSSIVKNEPTPANQTPAPKLIASPTFALRLAETAVPTQFVATNTPMPQPTTVPTLAPLATQTAQPTITTRPTVRATSRPTTAITQPPAKAGCPQGCQTQLPGCDIKGNISSSGEKIYHLPGGASYQGTKIDPSKGERWFCTEAEATANGWRKALR